MRRPPSHNEPRPPQWADKFLEWYCAPKLLDEIQGDLYEAFEERRLKYGLKKAERLFIKEVIFFCRPSSFAKNENKTMANFSMIKSYIKIARRNLSRNKSFAFLNIVGLAVGMACSVLILLWVQNELRYDSFHEHAEEIFRISVNSGDFKTAVSSPGMAQGLTSAIPEIKEGVRVSKPMTHLFEAGQQKFEEEGILYVDSNFLSFFSFPLIVGNTGSALDRPDAIVVSEKMAQKYFGNGNAIGKTIRRNGQDDFIVTALLANVPSNSHLQFDFLLPMSDLTKSTRDLQENAWGSFNYYTYLHLTEKAIDESYRATHLLPRISEVFHENVNLMKADFNLQPLRDIHLHSKLQIDVAGHGNIQYVNIFFVVALFILLVACINFMNLATAQSTHRAREVGLRKVIGARRGQLVAQFIGESMVIALVSFILSVTLVYIALPYFNVISGKEIHINYMYGRLIGTFVLVALTAALVSGSYPAFFLSGFRPVKVLQGKIRLSNSNRFFRNSLVVSQFAVSTALLVGTAVVFGQLDYLKEKNLGFSKENLIYVPFKGEIFEKQDALRGMLGENFLTEDFSIISDLPTNLTTGNTDIEWPGRDPNLQIVIPSMVVDENFIDVFQLDLLTGRGFSKEFGGETNKYLVNEKMAALMGVDAASAVGMELSFSDRLGTIAGVVKDFNFKPLQYEIEPLILRYRTTGRMLVVRTASDNTEKTIAALEKIHTDINPSQPFGFKFVDEDLDKLYRGEQQMGVIFNLFALLAIFISCLGLYGLSAFVAEQRMREIGVRKVLGASTFKLIKTLSGDFMKLILISICIALPLSWFLMEGWLQDFAYRISISFGTLIFAGLATLAVTLLTIGFHILKAASSSPIQSLRSEHN